MNKLCYDCHHYNNPEEGNKYIYAIGEYEGESIDKCGFIYADNKQQAKKVITLYNKMWNTHAIMMNYTHDECKKEYNRRKHE